MNRTLALVALVVLLAGCLRPYQRTSGPFAHRTKPDPHANVPVPPGPLPNSSPLALANDTQPEPPRPPDENLLVPTRPQDPPGPLQPPGGPQPQPKTNPNPPAPPTPPRKTDPASVAAQHIAEVKKLAAAAAQKWAKVETYEATVTRRELSPKGKMSEDVVLYQYRKEPMSVYIRNLDEAGKGRELLYNPTQHKDVIHVIIGKADENLLFKAGSKGPALSPDNALVKRESRYSIREAGWGTPIERVANWAAKAEAGKIPADALTYHGPIERKEYPYPLIGVQLKLRAGDERRGVAPDDPLLPIGGARQWFFDPKPDSPTFGLPVLIIATESDGREVEYYLFEKVRFGLAFTDADFSPDRLGGGGGRKR